MSQNTNDIFTIGVDVGGTKIEAALVNQEGQVLTTRRSMTNAKNGPDKVIADVARCIRACCGDDGTRVQGIGLGVAGQIDKVTGVVISSPNLWWDNVDIGNRLQQELGLPIMITNDVRAATYGEWKHGAGQGINDLVCLFIGTGIGGGVITHGNLLEGYNNSAAELGHMTIVSSGRACRCPNHGCMEAYAGGWAIAERAQESVQDDKQRGRLIIDLAGSIEAITAATVSRAYSMNDPLARYIIEETAQSLSAGVVSIVNAFNPCLLIFGGGVIQGIPDLIPLTEVLVRKYALKSASSRLKFTRAALGNLSAVIGAAALARKQLGNLY